MNTIESIQYYRVVVVVVVKVVVVVVYVYIKSFNNSKNTLGSTTQTVIESSPWHCHVQKLP
jgi:hypothetical protein